MDSVISRKRYGKDSQRSDPYTLGKAWLFWVRFGQRDLEKVVQSTANASLRKQEVTEKFRRLVLFKNQAEIWWVGFRLRKYTPFTRDHMPPVLLLYDHILLMMKRSWGQTWRSVRNCLCLSHQIVRILSCKGNSAGKKDGLPKPSSHSASYMFYAGKQVDFPLSLVRYTTRFIWTIWVSIRGEQAFN